jgi:hypothetical protein
VIPELSDTLSRTSPLPERWSAPVLHYDTIVADGLSMRRAGISSTGPSGVEMNGAAAELDASPLRRSWLELLERASTVEAMASGDPLVVRNELGVATGVMPVAEVFPQSDAPQRWQYARSNGVALHESWAAACQFGRWELAERHCVLRAWDGTGPAPVRLEHFDHDLPKTTSFEWSAFLFGSAAFAPEAHVVGVFGFPGSNDLPVALGFGARGDLGGAVRRATGEALQSLAFLWGEPVSEEPPPAPSPMFHLEYFQARAGRALLRKWLSGARAPRARTPETHCSARTVRYVDLTPTWLGRGLRVAKAMCSGAETLVFGDAPTRTHLPLELRTHPIG